jgi:hypothetical protein
MAGGTIYIIDSSSLIDAWKDLYPPDHFPPFWKHLEALIQAKRCYAPAEVIEEISRKADTGLGEWAKAQEGFEVPIDAQQQIAVAAILKTHPKLVDTMKGRSEGDPWVIGLAKVVDGCVVTQERSQGNANRPRIPNVCTAMGIPCTSLIGVIRAESWRMG